MPHHQAAALLALSALPVSLHSNLSKSLPAQLSILMADMTSGATGFLISTFSITIFGEIVPQAVRIPCLAYFLRLDSPCPALSLPSLSITTSPTARAGRRCPYKLVHRRSTHSRTDVSSFLHSSIHSFFPSFFESYRLFATIEFNAKDDECSDAFKSARFRFAHGILSRLGHWQSPWCTFLLFLPMLWLGQQVYSSTLPLAKRLALSTAETS